MLADLEVYIQSGMCILYMIHFFVHLDKINRFNEIQFNLKVGKVEEKNERGKDEIFSKRVKAGKRTYFFDVKTTKSNDYYLTITESKRKFKDDSPVYEKHKVFLYKEDFSKFISALEDTIDFVKSELMTDNEVRENEGTKDTDGISDDFSWS